MASLHHNGLIKSYQIIHIYKLEFNHNIDGMFTIEKVLWVHMQGVLEMSNCLYTNNYFKKNVGGKWIENW